MGDIALRRRGPSAAHIRCRGLKMLALGSAPWRSRPRRPDTKISARRGSAYEGRSLRAVSPCRNGDSVFCRLWGHVSARCRRVRPVFQFARGQAARLCATGRLFRQAVRRRKGVTSRWSTRQHARRMRALPRISTVAAADSRITTVRLQGRKAIAGPRRPGSAPSLFFRISLSLYG